MKELPVRSRSHERVVQTADLAVVGSGLGAALAVAVALDVGHKVAWLTTDDPGISQDSHGGAGIISQLLPVIGGYRETPRTRLRALASGRSVDWRAAWHRRKDTAFMVRRVLERRQTHEPQAEKALAALATASLRFYLTTAPRMQLGSVIEKTGALFLSANEAGRARLMASAAALDIPLIDLPVGNAGAGGDLAPQHLLCQQVWTMQDMSAMESALRAYIGRHSSFVLSGRLTAGKVASDRWLLTANTGMVDAAAMVLTSPDSVQRLDCRALARLPFGRMTVGQRHYAHLDGEKGVYVGGDGRFTMQPTSRGALVRLAPRLNPSRGRLQSEIDRIASGALDGLVGEPRDELTTFDIWEAPDGLPVLGPVAGVPGTWIMQCQTMQQAAFGPAMAQILMAMVRGEPFQVLQQVIGPERLRSSRPARKV